MILTGCMPEIGRCGGIVVSMPYKDHSPAHIHIWVSGFSAKVSLARKVVIAGKLPSKIFKKLRHWMETHDQLLRSNWTLIRANKPPIYIPEEE